MIEVIAYLIDVPEDLLAGSVSNGSPGSKDGRW